jgi:hypothetical protein
MNCGQPVLTTKLSCICKFKDNVATLSLNIYIHTHTYTHTYTHILFQGFIKSTIKITKVLSKNCYTLLPNLILFQMNVESTDIIGMVSTGIVLCVSFRSSGKAAASEILSY